MNLTVDQGVLVTEVIKGSPAANSGSLGQTLLARNDVIVELAGQPVTDVAGFGKILEKLRREKPPVVLVKYQRGLLAGFAGLNLSLGEKEQQNKQ
jgi:S1-C subfamily serine protease